MEIYENPWPSMATPGAHFDHLGTQGPKMLQIDPLGLLFVGSFGGLFFLEI